MNSLNTSSKWPSYDSLPSTSSFLHSESEQTEDEADVFSDGEGDSGITKLLLPREGIALSRNCLEFPAHSDQPRSKSKSDQPEHCPDGAKRPDSASSPGAATLSSSSTTPGDLVFAQKCANLQRFIHPLLGLLHGLETGRFDKGLSSVQKNVAIDRFQRILGILQRPDMGEKYLRHLLQIEVMLKIWFPQVPCQSTETPRQTSTPRLPPHWHQNQLQMPVKKRKLSWSNYDNSGSISAKNKQHQHGQNGQHGTCEGATSLHIATTSLPASIKTQKTQLEQRVEPPWGRFTAGHEFTDTTGALSRPSYLCHRRENENQKHPEISPPSPCGSSAAQDSSVSSTNTIATTDSL